MEFGDIIYFILLVFFMILGFFNDSRKKKQQQQKQSEAQERSETEFRPFLDEEQEIIPPQSQGKKRKTPPPIPAAYSAKERYDNFQSSIDLVSIHEEPSTLSSYTFDYNVNSFYELDPDSPDSPDSPDNVREDQSRKSLHPLLQGLRDGTGREELKKGLIYGEIMQRKY